MIRKRHGKGRNNQGMGSDGVTEVSVHVHHRIVALKNTLETMNSGRLWWSIHSFQL